MLRQTTPLQRRNLGTIHHIQQSWRRRHTHQTLPMHDANRFGGRSAQLREIGPINQRFRGRIFKKDPKLLQYNVDVWAAQQTLRKKWKGRNYDVVEVPFDLAPKTLQCVIPELYTELPKMADPANGDFSNIREKTFPIEEMQSVLFRATTTDQNDQQVMPYPMLTRVDKKQRTLDTFI